MELDEIVLRNPASIPKDRSTIPDDMLISNTVWAALQGISLDSVHANRTRSTRRREALADLREWLTSKVAEHAWMRDVVDLDSPTELTAQSWALPFASPPEGADAAVWAELIDRLEAWKKIGAYKPGDMPAEDTKLGPSPLWKMSTYRAWEASRPGKGAGSGRRKGVKMKPKPPKRLELPAPCPHCGHDITGQDIFDAAAEQ